MKKPMITNHKIRLSILLRTLIKNGFLSYDGQNLKTTLMTDHLLEAYKEGRESSLAQLNISFPGE